jgi:hypothetical protein
VGAPNSSRLNRFQIEFAREHTQSEQQRLLLGIQDLLD